jgi:hypothetical protein
MTNPMSQNSVRDTRHVALARTLHKRLYVNVEGRIFIAQGEIAYPKLVAALKRHARAPTTAEAPSPLDLGVSGSDGELPRSLLHDVGRAIHRWRLELAEELAHRPVDRRKTEQLIREQREIARLETSLADVRRWSDLLNSGGEPTGAPFFLDSVAELELQAAVNADRCIGLNPMLIAWQARIVFWLSGKRATERFLVALKGLFSSCLAESPYDQLRGFQKAVVAMKMRSESESTGHLVSEIARHVQRLAPEVVRAGKFSSRLRGRTFIEHCDLLLASCAELLRRDNLCRNHVAPATVAAIAAADGCSAAIPIRAFVNAARKSHLAQQLRTLEALAVQIGKPGYEALLLAIEKLPKAPSEFQFDVLRCALADGNSLADVMWAFEQDLISVLTESNLKIASARRLSGAFAQRGLPLNSGQLYTLAQGIQDKTHQAAVEAWLKWLSSVRPRALKPLVKKSLLTAFWKRYLPSVRQAGWFEHLTDCLKAARRTKNPHDASVLLERIACYQELAGRKDAAPKSLRKLLDCQDRQARELDHLRALQASGQLADSARLRLLWLENEAKKYTATGKLRRTAEEAFILLGLEAQCAVFQKLAEAKCWEHLGDLVNFLNPELIWDFAFWIDKMSAAERVRLRDVIAAHTHYGSDYKRILEKNQAWIAKAQAQGLDLEPWFAGEPAFETIGGCSFEIRLADELQDIFLMGEYFQTCLSLDGANQMSVLTNASDANKQVVFMFTRDEAGKRHVVGRQLIAISSDFKLLGYCCYVQWRHAEKEKRQEGVDALSRYCGTLAARCGMELGDQGTPEEIGDHFWYDDGECEWPAAARTAWHGAALAIC